MRSIYSSYANDDLWVIRETEFARPLQSIRESQFALGNGYLGSRGIYEELPYDCAPGTYIAGIYDSMTAQVSELVNFPNPINFKFTVGGEKLDVVAMDIVNHKRVLNMKKGILARQSVYKDSKGRCYDYQSARFISCKDKNIGVMQISITPLDAACELDIQTGIDTSISNAGVLSEGRKKHFRVKELGQHKNAGYVVADTFEKKHKVVFWAGFYYQLNTNGRKIVAKDNVFRLRLRKNQTALFTKVFCIKHFPIKEDHTLQKKDAFKIFYKAFKSNFSTLLKEHINAWEKFWKKADIIIEGTANLQINMRFNIYHMLICGHFDNGFSSVGARTLSGEGYRGHIFWDAEVFLMPFYLFTFPKIAKNMLLYRYRRLEASKEIAKSNGYKGVQFAWESADTGEEETPEWARDIDRRIIKIYTHKMEHHIVADVAFAVYKYYVATRDERFMQDYGYEILIETARFWASRVEYNKRKDLYEIKHVIGPDEFHVDVNNNAFTNMLAKWDLLTANKLISKLKKQIKLYNKIKEKVDLKKNELSTWRKIASKMKININKKNIIEQFGGYFRLKKIQLTQTDENGIPLMPDTIQAKDLHKTQLIKQADVLMLMSMLNDVFNSNTKRVNYDYYYPKTLHKSSLSAPMHAYIASDVGDMHRAYNFFNVAMRTDISNLYGNTSEGIHAASLGGTWQTLVFGFCGANIKKEELYIDPCLPRSWRKLIFSLLWQGNLVKLEVTNEVIKIRIKSAKRAIAKIGIFTKLAKLKTNRNYVFSRAAHALKAEEYY